MAQQVQLENSVKQNRVQRQWSQAELAARAGISRAAVSAIESNRLVPSVAAALALAEALDCRIEQLFGPGATDRSSNEDWAWPATASPCRYWHAEVQNRILRYPVESTACGYVEHDGVFRDGAFHSTSLHSPRKTLVMASCDPAAGLLASAISRVGEFRTIVLTRSSHQALELLGKGLVHVAGVHLSTKESPQGNRQAVTNRLHGKFKLLRVASWQEGIVLSPGSSLSSVSQVLSARLRWVGREPGSAAQECLNSLLGNRPGPRHVVFDHRSVATSLRAGWADAGICLRLVGEEAGLQFLSVRDELYELCFAESSDGDPRIAALIRAVRSATLRGFLNDLPGYDVSECGELNTIG